MQSLAELLQQLPTMEPSALTDEDLAQMPFDHLYQLRKRFTDQAMQNRLSPYEHRAFTREAASENPLQAPGLLMAAPIYQAKKMYADAMGARQARSEPSFEQIKQGWIGTGEGLLAGIRKLYQ